MGKRKLSEEEVTNSATQAFQDLLDLVFIDLEKKDNKKQKNNEIDNSKSIYIKAVNSPKKTLDSIINNAKSEISNIKSKCQKNYFLDPEEEIIKKAKDKGKSQYDSDVLRELILNRQKNKRLSNNGLLKVIENAKKNN
ncbi:hypothetical protein SLITO_v1c03610 [Spiroplasma litorale]|uniref:Uncharacterized protein n=1 Tax=Spiroplasma litorale TaxID=216942 RepID=A0A0K1W109_9MOLU|nr:hypothetical protein [Spiroplasma litorale]AKX34015.1 hypothetical protein SLITO_v1c03610 [Spiroplasma litorale]